MRFTSPSTLASPEKAPLALPPSPLKPSDPARRVLFTAELKVSTSSASSGRYGLNLKRRGGLIEIDDRELDSSEEEEDSESGAFGEVSDDDSDEELVTSTIWAAAPSRGLSQSRSPHTSLRQDPIDRYESESRSKAWRRSLASSTLHSTRIQSLLSPAPPAPRTTIDQQREREEREMNEVRQLLEGMRVERAEEERRDRAKFEQRNASLWEGIESTIKSSEQAHLLAQRQREQQAEAKARALREAAEAKARAEAEKAKREADAKAKEMEELAKKEKEKKGGGGLEVKAKEFGVWVEKMKEIKQNVLPRVNSSPEWKKKCSAVKRQITPKIGQVTNSIPNIIRVTSDISVILHSAQAASPDIYIWILNHLSKILIKQAEAEVTAKPAAAFPLARLIVALMLMGHAEGLGAVLMARFVKKCPWVIPFYPARQETQSEAEYIKSLGHLPTPSLNSGTPPESKEQYSGRMSGILTLYLAILHTLPSPNLLPPAPPSTSHPPYPPYSPELIPPHFRLTAGWSWLAAILRPPLPLLEHSPEFMVIFIEVLGGRMLAVYGRQTVKVLHVLLAASRAEGPQALGSGKNVPATARLRLKLEAWESSGVLKEIEGSEPSLD